MYQLVEGRRRLRLRSLLAGALVMVVGAAGLAAPGAAQAQTGRLPDEKERTEVPPRVMEVIDTLRKESDNLPREAVAVLPQVIERLEREGEQLLWPSEETGHIPAPSDGWVPPPVFQGPPDGEYFDVDVFARNIQNLLDSTSVGYAFSIGVNGQLAIELGRGDRRTEEDLPWSAWSAHKSITVASVSKTITAVLVLRLLDDHGIDVDDSVEPWLPESWDLPNAVDDLTFRALLTHESGLWQSFQDATGASDGATSSTGTYDNIRIAVENLQPGFSTGDPYANMNFSIFRLILPKLVWGYDWSLLYDNPFPLPAAIFDMLYGIYFEVLLQNLYAPIGVSISCSNSDPNPTILYHWPYAFVSGWEVPSYLRSCGGFGFHVTAHDLASFMSHLRYTEQLVSEETRNQMYDEELGIFQYAGGDYVGHSGRWRNPGVGGMRSCVMSFDIHVDASLVINSVDTFTPVTQPSACTVLRTAFEDAWV